MTDEEIKAQPVYWVAVSIPWGSTGKLEGSPRLAMMERGSDRLYWNGGQSHGILTSECVVHRYYPDGDEDGIIVQFHHDFPPPASDPVVLARGGWLAPDGKYYQCHTWQHGYYASCLCALYYRTLEDEKRLEQEGWIRIHGDGTAMWPIDNRPGLLPYPATQAQIDRLFDLTQVTDFSYVREKDWRYNASRNLRLVGVGATA